MIQIAAHLYNTKQVYTKLVKILQYLEVKMRPLKITTQAAAT